MTSLVEFILGGSTELNAYSLVAFMTFVIIVYAIASIVRSCLSVGGHIR